MSPLHLTQPHIFHNVYTPLGDVWDILVLINSSVNFLLYCTMSRLFRGTFWALFVAPLCGRCCPAEYQDGRDHPQPSTCRTPIKRVESAPPATSV